MTRISTASENSLTLYYMQLNQSAEQNLNAEISTGYSAQTYSQIAPQAAQLEQYRAEVSQQQSYINTINTASTSMQTMQLSLQQILSQVQSFTSNLANSAYSTQAPTVQTQAASLLQQVAGYLNVQDGSNYLFAGTNTQTPPVDLSNLPQGAAATLTDSVGGPPSTGGYYNGGATNSPVQIDAQVSVNYSVNADNPAFENIIRALNFIAQSGSFSSDQPHRPGQRHPGRPDARERLSDPDRDQRQPRAAAGADEERRDAASEHAHHRAEQHRHHRRGEPGDGDHPAAKPGDADPGILLGDQHHPEAEPGQFHGLTRLARRLRRTTGC